MARYESLTHFWEAEVIGSELHRRSGKLGNKGRASQRKFESVTAARYAFRKAAEEKLAADFRLVVPDEPPEPMEPIDEALDRQLLEDPSDAAAAGVLGDWLQTQGAARGELIVLQQALPEAKGASARALIQEQKRLITRHASALLGSVADIANFFELSWRLGFIQRARLIVDRSGRIRDQIKRRFKGLDQSRLLAYVLQDLLQTRSARLLESLSLESIGGRDFGPALRVLAESSPTTLRRLRVPATKPLNASLGVLEGVDADRGAWLGYRAGEYADAGINLGAQAFGLAGVEALTVEPPIAYPGLQTVSDGDWPDLQVLELNCSARRSDMPQLTGALRMPKLRELRLWGLRFPRDFVDALLAAPVRRQLEAIDVSGGTFDDALAHQIVLNRAEFPRLKRFVVHRCQLTRVGRQRLQDAGLQINLPPVPQSDVITDERISELCTDERVEAAGRELADPKYWQLLGRDKFRLWGVCHAGRRYQLLVGLPELRAHCNCMSRKSPCKHAIALMLLAADDGVPEGKLPSWLY